MEATRTSDVSSSTLSRFTRSHRLKELPAYRHFKK
jgi:hypothetical protein